MPVPRIPYEPGEDVGDGITVLDPKPVPMEGWSVNTQGRLPDGIKLRCWCGEAYICAQSKVVRTRGHDRSCAQKNPHPRSDAHVDRLARQEAHKAAVEANRARGRELDFYEPLVAAFLLAVRSDYRYTVEIAQDGARIAARRGEDLSRSPISV